VAFQIEDPVGDSLTDVERANLEGLERYVSLFNGDVMDRFIREMFHPDFTLTIVDGTDFDGSEPTMVGDQQTLIDVETLIKSAYPGRRIVVDRAIASGDTVVFEAALVDDGNAGFRLGWIAVLRWRDGRVYRAVLSESPSVAWVAQGSRARVIGSGSSGGRTVTHGATRHPVSHKLGTALLVRRPVISGRDAPLRAASRRPPTAAFIAARH
jgi:hypothetical protein